MVILISVVTPQSRGRVRLRKPSFLDLDEPFPQPEVDPAYLSHPTDLARLVEALSWMWATLQGAPKCYRPARHENQSAIISPLLPHRSDPESREIFKTLNLEPHLPSYSSCPTVASCNDELNELALRQWDASLICLVQSAIVSNFHYAGTCPVKGIGGPVLSENLR